MSTTLFICGAGNPEGVRLAIRQNEKHRRWDSIVLLDDNPARLGETQLGIPVAGGFDRLQAADPAAAQVVNLVARTTQKRREARHRIASFGLPWTSLVGDDVDVLGAQVGSDLIAYQHATVGPEARIGEGVVVFMAATVGHECHVGDHCIVAANAVLNARVRLGTGVYVGSNAVVLPEISIGDNATVGAGAVVLDDVPAGATVVAGASEIVSVSGAQAPGAPITSAAATPSARTDPADAALGASLSKLWCEILHVDAPSGTRNFFDLGGNSLMALRLAQRIEATTGRSLCVVDVFRYPTLEQLQAHLTGQSAERQSPSTQAAQRRADFRRTLARRDDRTPREHG